ncbi:hypothetical protein BDN67DRAFT_970096 [Paxillus ammoniavirescens]|nr:hypothetical protein BDN67DRAFT_970096 [Paxillus ammoniavirescens]
MSSTDSQSNEGGKPESSPNAHPPSPQRRIPVQTPWLSLTRQPPGRAPNGIDERCFTYCSQTSLGRAEGREPNCRTICLRKVFPHELTTFIFHGRTGQKRQETDHFPLPPEGQPTSEHHLDDFDSPSTSDEDTRYWEEGWYLWTSRSRWAAQEKLGLMSHNLASQDNWQRYKDNFERRHEAEWAERRPQGIPTARGNSGFFRIEIDRVMTSETLPPERPEFPWHSSWLTPLPPPLAPLLEPIRNLLAPTFKAMDIFGQSIESGSQRDFALRMWEKARSPEPFILARNVCRKVWEKWKEGPPDSDAEPDV